MAETPHLHPDPAARFKDLLHRPAEQRAREFKYRLAQTLVFGLPVIVLQIYGRSLGGSPLEAQRWVCLLQLLLSGWVVYVAALGMLAEGVFVAISMKRMTLDLPVAGVAVLGYTYSGVCIVGIVFQGRPLAAPWFHWVVLLLGVWCAGRFAILARSAR